MRNARTILFNKPDGVLSSFTGEPGQETLKDFIDLPGVYAAGRLDLDSEGLLLLSDDGALIHKLLEPGHRLAKTYLVQVEGDVSQEAVNALASGITIKGRLTKRCLVLSIPEPDLPSRRKPVTPHMATTWLRIELREGMNRQIRHMTAAVGFPALRIIRVAIGRLSLEGLDPGKWRPLTEEESVYVRSLSTTHD